MTINFTLVGLVQIRYCRTSDKQNDAKDDGHMSGSQRDVHLSWLGNNCLCRSNFILVFCIFGICHIVIDIQILERCYSDYFYGFPGFYWYMWRGGSKYWCGSHFTFPFYTSGFRLMLTDIWTLGQGFVVAFFWLSLRYCAHVSVWWSLLM